MSTKGCSGFFFILLISWVICQNHKRPDSTHSQKPSLSITHDLNKINKNPEHPYVDIGK